VNESHGLLSPQKLTAIDGGSLTAIDGDSGMPTRCGVEGTVESNRSLRYRTCDSVITFRYALRSPAALGHYFWNGIVGFLGDDNQTTAWSIGFFASLLGSNSARHRDPLTVFHQKTVKMGKNEPKSTYT
jgi:hypothetical protein